MTVLTPVQICQISNAANTSGSASSPTTFADAPAGSLIIAGVFCTSSNSNITSFGDGINNTYNIIQPAASNLQTNQAICWFNTVVDVPIGSSFTASTTGGVSSWRMRGAWKIPGMLGVDTSQTGSVPTTSTGTTQSTGTLASPNEIVIGMVSINDSAVVITPPAGWLLLFFGTNNQLICSQIVNSTASVTFAPTWTSETLVTVGWSLSSFQSSGLATAGRPMVFT